MDWPIVILILGALGIVLIFILGGTITAGKGGFTLGTKRGFLDYLQKANENRDLPAANIERKDYPAPSKIAGSLVLWVDDHPDQNLYERLALASLGVFCDAYTTNDEAMIALDEIKHEVIISDIGRDEVEESGWDLLARARASHPATPFIFYTMGIDDQLKNEAEEKGARGIMETPDDLVKQVLQVLSRKG